MTRGTCWMAYREPHVKWRARQTQVFVGPMWDMCHHLIGGKSKVVDKGIWGIQESQEESDKWQD